MYIHRTKIYSEQKILRYWQHLQSESNFCDVTLVCDDRSIKTHKFMIYSRSPVLKNILNILK